MYKYICIYFVFFAISRAAPAAYGGSQARGLIGAIVPAYARATATPEPQQCGIRAVSATYTAALDP